MVWMNGRMEWDGMEWNGMGWDRMGRNELMELVIYTPAKAKFTLDGIGRIKDIVFWLPAAFR